MAEEKVIGKFKYDKDSKRYHRFRIETEAGVTGTVYVPKEIVMPKTIELEYARNEQ